MPVTGHLAVFR